MEMTNHKFKEFTVTVDCRERDMEVEEYVWAESVAEACGLAETQHTEACCCQYCGQSDHCDGMDQVPVCDCKASRCEVKS